MTARACTTHPERPATPKPRACSNYSPGRVNLCRGTVTHAVIGFRTALDSCERCAREWYAVHPAAPVIIRTPFERFPGLHAADVAYLSLSSIVGPVTR